ncbi:MAG: hypothetical protein ACE149_11640 [Armatimonadota bacterium]
MTRTPLSDHTWFVGSRGHYELLGEFEPEPDWARLAQRDPELLRDVRLCDTLPQRELAARLEKGAGWPGGTIVLLPAVRAKRVRVDGRLRRIHRPSERFRSDYTTSYLTEHQPPVYRSLAYLNLGSAGELVRFARSWGVPTQLSRPDGSYYCPVLRLQYDSSLLRLLLRLAAALQTAVPDGDELRRLVGELLILRQESKPDWLRLAAPGISGAFTRSRRHGALDDEVDLGLPMHDLETPFGERKHSGVRLGPGLLAGINGLKVGFGPALSNCFPTLDVGRERDGRLRVRPAFTLVHGETRSTALRDILYLQAWEDLGNDALGRCGCGCDQLVFLTGQQRRRMQAGDRVYLPGHAGRRRRRPPADEQEAEERRAEWRSQKCDQRARKRQEAIRSGTPPRPRGRPRKPHL